MRQTYWMIPPMLFLILWVVTTYGFGVSNALLPRPHAVLVCVFNLLIDGRFRSDTLATLRAGALGLLVGFGAGYILGVISGVVRWIDEALSPSLHFLRSIPSVAYYPIIVLYLGFGEGGRIVLVALPVFLLTFVSCVTATLSVNLHRKTYLVGLGASRWQIFRLLLVWETLPGVVNAIRLSVSLALVLVVFGELTIGGTVGLGTRLRDAREIYALEEVYGIVIILGCIGWLANRAISAVESKLLISWGR